MVAAAVGDDPPLAPPCLFTSSSFPEEYIVSSLNYPLHHALLHWRRCIQWRSAMGRAPSTKRRGFDPPWCQNILLFEDHLALHSLVFPSLFLTLFPFQNTNNSYFQSAQVVNVFYPGALRPEDAMIHLAVPDTQILVEKNDGISKYTVVLLAEREGK